MQWTGYSKDKKIAYLQLMLERDGKIGAFDRRITELCKGKTWRQIQNRPLVANQFASQLAHEFYPEFFPDAASFQRLRVDEAEKPLSSIALDGSRANPRYFVNELFPEPQNPETHTLISCLPPAMPVESVQHATEPDSFCHDLFTDPFFRRARSYMKRARLKLQLEKGGPPKPVKLVPINQNCFVVFNTNASLIGRLQDADLTEQIIRVYSLSKYLVDLINYHQAKFELLARLRHEAKAGSKVSELQEELARSFRTIATITAIIRPAADRVLVKINTRLNHPR